MNSKQIIIKLRESGLTDAEIAEASGRDRVSIWRIRTGRRLKVDEVTAAKLKDLWLQRKGMVA